MVSSSWLEIEVEFVHCPVAAITFGNLVKELGDFPYLGDPPAINQMDSSGILSLPLSRMLFILNSIIQVI